MYVGTRTLNGDSSLSTANAPRRGQSFAQADIEGIDLNYISEEIEKESGKR
jgi:hypothetical protein